MPKLYFKSVKTGRKFEVLNIDRDKGEITLKGEYAPFVEPYDKERFRQLGYVLEKENEDAV